MENQIEKDTGFLILGGHNMTVYEEFKRRGLIAQCTDEETVKDLLENQKINK